MSNESDSYPPSPVNGRGPSGGQDGGGHSTVASSMIFTSDEGYPDLGNRPRRKQDLRRFATQCAVVDDPDPAHHDQHGASSVPLYQTATFKGMPGQIYDYSRSGNPTRTFLQHHIAKISNAKHAFAVSSGMAALDVIFRTIKPGDEIIAGNDLYGGSNRLLTFLKTSGGFTVHHLDTTKPELLLPYLQKKDSKVRWVLLESPTNPLIQIADIELLSNMVHRYVPEAVVIVDNTMMSPFLQRPLELGADIVYDSATKYLSGHHDLMAGAIYCNRQDLASNIAFTINSIGNGLAPFDCFLLLRGIKTMAIRMEKQQSTACLVATYLNNLGFKVNFPALANHPGKEIHDRIASGPGAVLSFETDDTSLSERIVGATRLWGISVSFGAVNSLISMPCLMSHASIDPKVRKERNLPEHLIRLCVGIEDPDDLLDDLESALLQAGAIRIVDDPDLPGEQKIERVPVQGQPEESSPVASTSAGASSATAQDTVPDFITSAPGKVILFGEHAVVHGVTAVAGALDLRCYCHVESRSDNKVSLILSDIGLERTWSLDDLPFDKFHANANDESDQDAQDTDYDTLPNAHASPNPALLATIASSALLAKEGEDMSSKIALSPQTFLYLYMRLSKPNQPLARTFTIRSALPIGAGLGSSAAFSVCLSTALLYLNNHIPLPSSSTPVPSSVISADHAHLINSWAFVGEKILHGNPSGVDNSVSSLGSALVFQKSKYPGEAPTMKSLHHFRSIRFLLTDTRVPRDTKTLVAGVAKRKEADPEHIGQLLKEIQQISDQAVSTLDGSEQSRAEQIARLESLVDRNHEILNELGVGHAALEAIKMKAAQPPYNLHTKLTGAGGGGCAVTIVPDDFSEERLQQLKAELNADGFACYETAVGGSGVGIFSLPARKSSSSGEEDRQHVLSEGGAEENIVPLKTEFENTPTKDLHEWADKIGKWSYA